jgi:hypothetical protein
MPWFTLHRNYVLSTTAGHVLRFEKDKSTWVPPACVANAVAIGAQPVDPLPVEADIFPPEPKTPVALTPEQRQKTFFDAFETLLLRSARGDFTASGLPHLKQLEPLIGFPVSQQERDEFWDKYNVSKQEAA